jgi:phage terminase Nu1 subunit (DNA packaging protein)
MRVKTSALDPMTFAETAQLLGADPRTVAAWIAKDGMPTTNRRGANGRPLVDPVAAVAWIRARERRAAEERLRAALAQTQDPLDRKRTAEAELREMDVARRKGDLVPRDEIERQWSQLASATREAMLAVPGMAVQLGVVDRPAELRLEDLVRDALTALASRVDASADEDDLEGEPKESVE